MSLRPSVRTAIVQALGRNASFVHTDFEVTTTEASNQGVKVKITYRHGDGYFVAQFPNKPTTNDKGEKVHNVQLTFKPGLLNLVEAATTQGEYLLCEEIERWTKRVHEDLMSSPMARKILDHERQLNELYATIGIKDDEPLEEDEAGSLIDRIRELELKLAENIEKSEADARTVRQRLDTLHQQVEALCVIIQTQPTKKGAVRAILGRILGWSAHPENNKLLGDAGKTIAGLLAGGGS